MCVPQTNSSFVSDLFFVGIFCFSCKCSWVHTQKHTFQTKKPPGNARNAPTMPMKNIRMGCLRLRGTARAIDVGKIIHVPLARWAAWEKGPFLLFLVCRGCDVGIIISIPTKQPGWLMESIPAVFSSWLRCIGNPGFASHLFVMNGGDT